MVRPEEVTAIVLCGGAGSRLGAPDKTLVPVLGRPLVCHTVDALAAQVGRVVLSCGRDPAAYAPLGLEVVADESPGQGPLGGVATVLRTIDSDWFLLYPGDAPFPDHRLVARLGPIADAHGIAVPRTNSQRQHLVALLSRAAAERLVAWYDAGGRAIRRWLDEVGVDGVDMSDVAHSFFNVNSPADLAACEDRLASDDDRHLEQSVASD